MPPCFFEPQAEIEGMMLRGPSPLRKTWHSPSRVELPPLVDIPLVVALAPKQSSQAHI